MASKQSDNHIKIDVQSLEAELRTMMLNKPLFMPEGCCIFPVPTILSRHNPNAYTPNAFSIGPFCFEKLPLIKATQNIKLKYLNHLITRPWKDNRPHKSRLGIITKAVTGVLEESRRCYAGSQNFTKTDDEFIKIMILDGCFLVELFRKKAYGGDLIESDDPIFTMSCLLQYLCHDLILLENQIPWIVLQTLFDLTKPQNETKTLVELVIEFFGNMFSAEPPAIEDTNTISKLNKESKHILDLLRNSLIFTSSVQNNETQTWQPIRSVTSLTEAGIKFSPALSKTNILDIEFLDGVFAIPPLLIQETTETVFRNLICLEQCCPNYEPIITSYAILMDRLIDTNKDMELLTKSGAIHNWLNIEDATKFFNKLYDDAYVKKNYYCPLSMKVNRYCANRCPRWRTALVHDYFRHPWALISVIAATMILIFAFLQTLFTIIN